MHTATPSQTWPIPRVLTTPGGWFHAVCANWLRYNEDRASRNLRCQRVFSPHTRPWLWCDPPQITLWKTQFTSLAFTQNLKDHHIRISVDGKGAGRDKVFVERLLKTVKFVHVYLHAYDSTSEVKTKIDRYFEFYIQRRPHSKFDRQTPDQFYLNSLPSKQAA